MADYTGLAAQLRATREAEGKARIAQSQQGGAATSNGGIVGQGGSNGVLGSTGGFQPPQNQPQNQQQSNPLQQGLDAYNKYRDVSKLFQGGAGSSLGATGTSYAGSSLGGTGFGLGGTLVEGGASGAGTGSGLGSMLGSYGGASTAAPSSFGALGSTTAGGANGLLSGAGASSGSALGGGSSAAAGGGAAGGGGLAAGGWLAALAAAAHIGDKEMNENKGSIINADKLNDAGTIGGSGIGIRFGDFGNAFNPATWLSDPKKAGKSIVNAFTLGFLDKFM